MSSPDTAPFVDPLDDGTLQPIVIAVRARLGKDIAPSTVTRWCLHGLTISGRRVRLRAIRAGGGWRTTARALDLFFEEQTAAARAAVATEARSNEGPETERRLRECGLV